jgi:AraC-like DNA-binding protein
MTGDEAGPRREDERVVSIPDGVRRTVAADDLPLSMHPSFRADTIGRLSEAVHVKLAATIARVLEDRPSIRAQGNRFVLPSSVLWSCCYGLPIRLKFPEGANLRVQFHRRGLGAAQVGKESVPVSKSQSPMHMGETDVDFGADFAQVAWQIPLDSLERKLGALLGSPVTRRLEVDPVLDLTTPQARTMLQVLESLLGIIDAGPAGPSQLIRSELESALLVALLCSARHNYRDTIERGAPAAAPWQVRRAESYIEANWDKPVSVEDIVAASGASARSVFRAFRQSRGYTPLQFVKQVRLRQAKRLLEDPAANLSVTEIALVCGFSDISNFSKDFSRTFGVPPSNFLQGKRAGGNFPAAQS